MPRAAILIGAPALAGHDYLKGVDSDMKALETFLLSSNGGAWKPTEIIKLKNPNRATILGILAQLEKSVDYLFCAFGGHGHHPVTHDQTSLCINDKEEIKVSELFPAIARQTLVIDACRHLTREILELSRKTAALMEARAAPSTYHASCRALFDTAIAKAEKGRIVAYSCSTDESADDGLFTPALVATSEEWALENGPNHGQTATKVLSIADSFKLAEQATLRKNKLQNPEFVPGRRLGYFPFAVA